MGLRRVIIIVGTTAALALSGFVGYVAVLGIDSKQASLCRGTAGAGSLRDGRRLPYAGDNYRSYSVAGFLLGRTFVHSAVRDTVRDAYLALARDHPNLRFIYAEGSWPWGGQLAPHRTHRNGTAIDFHVPVRTADGKTSELPANVFNQLGYGIDFDKSGRYGLLTIDFEAMALHLAALDRAARAHGTTIQRVIFDTDLQPLLLATTAGARLRGRIAFNTTQSWVRHDEHYHVDFIMPCK